MNSAAAKPVPWSRGRMWVYFGVVMAVQVILLLALSERKPLLPRQLEPGTSFYAVTELSPDSPVAALLDLGDPTFFALPHPLGFSGPAWLNTLPLQYRSADWTEPPRLLVQSGARLGETFQAFLRTNSFPHRSAAARPTPAADRVSVRPVPIRARSSYRVEGDLVGRELLTPLEVPSVAHTDILTNTVVQLGVSPSGFPLSVVALERSGSKLADQQALDLARAVRFKPLAATSSQGSLPLTWGRMIFQWHTVERTNAATAASP